MKNVSVVIPAYNKAHFTVKTVESVLNQTYKNIEVIVVDDGSTDYTARLLEPFADRIRYVYKENGGVSSARNLGIRLATGDYVGLLDCDDVYLPEKIEKSVEYLEKRRDFGFVHTLAYLMGEDGSILRDTFLYRSLRRGRFSKSLILGNFICNSTVVARRSCFDRVGFFNEGIFIPADWDMWIRLAESYKGGYINEPLTAYRVSCDYFTPAHLDKSKNEQFAVLAGAFARNPSFKPGFKKRAVSNVHKRIGLTHFRTRNITLAKREMVQAIRGYRFNVNTMFMFSAMAILGENLYSVLKIFRPVAAMNRKLTGIIGLKREKVALEKRKTPR